MKLYRRQRGISAIGWLFLIGLLSVIVMVGLRLTPVYLEHFSVTSSLKSLSRAEEGMQSAADIKARLNRMLNINNVTNLHPDDIVVQHRGGGVYEVSAAYEVRTRFIGNIDFVVFFDERAEVIVR